MGPPWSSDVAVDAAVPSDLRLPGDKVGRSEVCAGEADFDGGADHHRLALLVGAGWSSSTCTRLGGEGNSRARLRVQVFDLTGRQEHDILGDVGHAVADALEVVGGEQDSRTGINLGRFGSHLV